MQARTRNLQRLGVVLAQVAMPDTTNEAGAVGAVLEQLLLEGRTVTMDAAFTQWTVAEQVVLHGGAYLMMVKAKQSSMLAAIAERTRYVGRCLGEVQSTTLAHGAAAHAYLSGRMAEDLSPLLALWDRISYPALRQLAAGVRGGQPGRGAFSDEDQWIYSPGVDRRQVSVRCRRSQKNELRRPKGLVPSVVLERDIQSNAVGRDRSVLDRDVHPVDFRYPQIAHGFRGSLDRGSRRGGPRFATSPDDLGHAINAVGHVSTLDGLICGRAPARWPPVYGDDVIAHVALRI
jgi:hypothetical protein